MPESVVCDRRVMVVEDDYFWADELSSGLRRAGAAVIGPVGNVQAALDLVRTEANLDAAIIDMNLKGERADALADFLIERGVPVLLVTGYDWNALPLAYGALKRLEKPVAFGAVLAALDSLWLLS